MSRWHEAARPTLRPTTFATYRSLCHVMRIRKQRLNRVTALSLQELYADLEAQGVSPRTRQHVHALLHKALGQAVRWGLLRENLIGLGHRRRKSTHSTRTR